MYELHSFNAPVIKMTNEKIANTNMATYAHHIRKKANSKSQVSNSSNPTKIHIPIPISTGFNSICVYIIMPANPRWTYAIGFKSG